MNESEVYPGAAVDFQVMSDEQRVHALEMAKRYEAFMTTDHVKNLADYWSRGLLFTVGGHARLADIRGYLRGMVAAGDDRSMKTAFGLFCDLAKNLDYLNSYGDDLEATFEDDRPVENVPAWKVYLGDDGTWGGFSLLWGRAIEIGDLAKLRDTSIHPDSHPVFTYPDGRTVEGWAYACENKEKGLVAQRRTYYYLQSFNGGLLYHGPGGDEVFSVDIGAASGRPTLWSVHT